LRKSILKRALLNNWFETHLWLVKRFKMKSKFGYLIPFKRRDKSFKACYRYFKHDAVLNDCSHFNYLIININNIQDENRVYMNDCSPGINKYDDVYFETILFYKFLQSFLQKTTLDKEIFIIRKI